MNEDTIMHNALFTDFYELTMAQGFWKRGYVGRRVVFDYFFRRHPFAGGYSVFAGLDSLLDALENFRFGQDDLAYLESLGSFDKGFLDFLAGFKFTGTLYAAKEGEIIFPQEPLVRIEADLLQAQIIEGVILNTINFQNLIATKSARVWLASGKGHIMEFGLRRAQGADGALSATRAAFIGGAFGTSNTIAGKRFGIPVLGTMAHSWVMSYPTELEAFRAYASTYPDGTVFLIDTYNTLESGTANAIIAGKELQAQGHNFGVRLDSGDIDYLTREVRRKLDEAGCPKATITVSNDLDESIIEHLVATKAPIDTWGVGTNLVTGGNDAAFTGVYKLAAIQDGDGFRPVMKISDNPEKTTNPGIKGLYRIYNGDNIPRLDLITVNDEIPEEGKPLTAYHPSGDYRQLQTVPTKVEPLLSKVFEGGVRVGERPSLKESQAYFMKRIQLFDSTYLRQLNPHVYKVSISGRLKQTKLGIIAQNQATRYANLTK